jgi:hypothetical protein
MAVILRPPSFFALIYAPLQTTGQRRLRVAAPPALDALVRYPFDPFAAMSYDSMLPWIRHLIQFFLVCFCCWQFGSLSTSASPTTIFASLKVHAQRCPSSNLHSHHNFFIWPVFFLQFRDFISCLFLIRFFDIINCLCPCFQPS